MQYRNLYPCPPISPNPTTMAAHPVNLLAPLTFGYSRARNKQTNAVSTLLMHNFYSLLWNLQNLCITLSASSPKTTRRCLWDVVLVTLQLTGWQGSTTGISSRFPGHITQNCSICRVHPVNTEKSFPITGLQLNFMIGCHACQSLIFQEKQLNSRFPVDLHISKSCRHPVTLQRDNFGHTVHTTVPSTFMLQSVVQKCVICFI